MVPLLRRIISLILFLLIVATISANTIVQEQLILQHQGGLFPSVAEFSRIEDPLRPTHESVRVVYRALQDFYGKTWFDRYVHADEAVSLNRLHGNLLSSILPATFAVGKARIYPDYVLVPLMVQQRDSGMQRWDLMLSKNDQGEWKIEGLSLP